MKVTQMFRRRFARVTVGLLLLALTGIAAAEPPASGRFDLRSVETRLVDDVYRLDAIARLELSPRARDALEGGIALVIALEVEILRERAWWLDAEVATVRRRLRLERHELSQQYIVINLSTGERRSFHRPRTALDFIGRGLDFPIIDAVVIDDPERYYGRARMRLEREALPWALRPAALAFGDWRLQTGWVTWSFD